MGRAGKWLRSFLTGKKEKDGREKGEDNSKPAPVAVAVAAAATPPAPKEKKRWSFRRSVGRGGSRELNSPEPTAANGPAVVLQHAGLDSEMEQKRHAMAMAAATASVAGAAVAAAQAAAAVIRLTASSAPGRSSAAIEEAAAVKIQSTFRAYLARKALRALKGLVKLQALVRGHLVRKQATATLRCMQALVTAQARARAQRILTRTADLVDPPAASPLQLQRQSTHRRSPPPDPRFHRQHPAYEHEMERNLEEVVDIKIVEMDLGAESKGSCCTKSRNSYSIPPQSERSDHRRLSSASYYGGAAPRPHSTPDLHLHHHQHHPVSPSPSAALTDMSPRACSGRFEEFSFPTAAAKPPLAPMSGDGDGDCPLFPNYMANTELSRAKARSQSAPKQRPVDVTCERQPSRRRSSMEGGGRPPGVHHLPRGVRMQRSCSHVGSATNGYHDQCYPLSLKLDRSSVSLKDSECGSTSTALTANTNNYCKSLFSYEIYGTRC